MTDEDKKLIEAANMISDYCRKRGNSCEGCLFAFERKGNDMILCGITCDCGIPSHWRIPEPSRWTDADVSLAKSLMAFGSTRIHKYENDSTVIYERNGIFPCDCRLPYHAFASLKQGETVYLKDIVAEGENDG